MPVYNILGTYFFVPDLSDLSTYIVSPISSYLAQKAAEIISNIGASISSWIQPIIQPIYSWIQSVIVAVSAIVSPIWTQIQTALSGFANWILGGVHSLIQNIINWITWIPQQIQTYISPLFTQLYNNISSFINTAIIPALHGDLSGIGAAIGNILTFFLPVQSFITGYLVNWLQANGIDIAAMALQIPLIGTAISGLTIQTQKNANATNQALSDIGTSIMKAMTEYVVKPLQEFFAFVGKSLSDAVASLSQMVYQYMLSLAPTQPTGAAIKALTVIGFLGGIFASTYIAATISDLAHPMKKTKLQDLPEFVQGLMGASAISQTIMGAIAAPMFDLPIRHELNAILRPSLAPLQDLDEALRRKIIQTGDYRTQVAFYGLPDVAIETHIKLLDTLMSEQELNKALFWGVINDSRWDFGLQQLGHGAEERAIKKVTRYDIPNVRIIANLFLAGGFNLQQMTDYLVRSGLNDADRLNLIAAYQVSQLKDEKASIRSTLRRGYKLGWYRADLIRVSLQNLGSLPTEIDLFIKNSEMEYALDLREEKKGILVLAFEKAQLTDEELLGGLLNLGMEERKAKDLVAKEVFKVMPKPKASKETAIE